MITYIEKDYTDQFDSYHFFYGSWLSNWAQTPFSAYSALHSKLDDVPSHGWVKFNCSEQYMMLHKALLFDDYDTANLIRLESHPKDQKALGRKVKNFNLNIWNKNAKRIVYEACHWKFNKNRDAYNFLLSTKGKLLVEASPTDCVWGIGLGEENPLRLDPKNWRGTNWLGQVLTQLREEYLK